MSFDTSPSTSLLISTLVSIPLEQGNVFRQLKSKQNQFLLIVSIPLEQGNVFRPVRQSERWNNENGLNPFGTGQCLSTAVGC